MMTLNNERNVLIFMGDIVPNIVNHKQNITSVGAYSIVLYTIYIYIYI